MLGGDIVLTHIASGQTEIAAAASPVSATAVPSIRPEPCRDRSWMLAPVGQVIFRHDLVYSDELSN